MPLAVLVLENAKTLHSTYCARVLTTGSRGWSQQT